MQEPPKEAKVELTIINAGRHFHYGRRPDNMPWRVGGIRKPSEIR